MDRSSHRIKSTALTVAVFAALLIGLALVAGAGIAIVVAILVAGLAIPLVILIAIHRDEVPVERLTRRLR